MLNVRFKHEGTGQVAELQLALKPYCVLRHDNPADVAFHTGELSADGPVEQEAPLATTSLPLGVSSLPEHTTELAWSSAMSAVCLQKEVAVLQSELASRESSRQEQHTAT